MKADQPDSQALQWVSRVTYLCVVFAFLFLVVGCGTSPDENTPRTKILKDTRPDSLPPLDTRKVGQGVSSVGKDVVKLSVHTETVRRYNERLQAAIARGADRDELASLTKQQGEELVMLTKANESLQEKYDTLKIDYDKLVFDSGAKAENDKQKDKHADATIDSHSTVEEEKAEAVKEKNKLQRWIDRNKWIVNGFYTLIVVAILIFLVRLYFRR